MCIKHHTHCSVESVEERGATVPSLSQCVTQVDGLTKIEQRTRTAQGLEDRGHPALLDGLKACAAKPPLLNI